MTELSREERERQIRELHVRHSGLFALSAIARHHNLPLDMQQLMHDHAVGENDITRRELISFAGKHSLKAKCVSLKWQRFEKIAPVLPCILEKKNGHYAILCGLRKAQSKEGEEPASVKEFEAALVDTEKQLENPTENFCFINREQYGELFTGKAILIKRIYALTDEDQPFGLR